MEGSIVMRVGTAAGSKRVKCVWSEVSDDENTNAPKAFLCVSLRVINLS
jgi:hypothetical protein